MLHDRRVLVYELHITNFDMVPLSLKRVEVFGDNDSQPLTTLSDTALSQALAEAGTMMGTKASPAIAPGKREIVFMWLELPPDKPMPALLKHRIAFSASAAGASSSAESTLENFPVAVSGETALLLSSPFDGGIWLAGSGPGNGSDHRRTIIAIDGHIHSPERFAIDWVKVGPNGDSHHDGTSRNENFWAYGEPVHAVADGEVTRVVDTIEENTPRVLPKGLVLDEIAGNYVIMKVGPNRYATYAHLQKGSIKVHPHEKVRRGTVIALVGNTGQATAPHLHFQVTDSDSVLQSEGVPFGFDRFTYLGPGSEFELDKHPSIPWQNSIPSEDAVIELPSIR